MQFRQFLEILNLLSMIQKEERQLNMVKYQLYLAKKEQELSLFKSLLSNTSTNIHRINDSPLNVWFCEIKQWMSTNECWKMSEGIIKLEICFTTLQLQSIEMPT